MENKVLSALPVTNFILSLLIVFHHAFTTDIGYVGSFLLSSYGLDIAVQRYMYNLSECAVPVFYFLSAYLFFRTYDGSWGQYKKKIVRRFYSLFVPYVIFCTLGYIKHILAAGLIERGSIIEGWLCELWLCETMPLWFIRELMALALLAPCFYWLRNHWFVALSISALILALVVFGYVPYRSFVYWIPIYLLGVYMKRNLWDCLYQRLLRNRIIVVNAIISYMIICWFLPNGNSTSLETNLFFILFRIITPIVYIPILIYIACKNVEIHSWMNYSFFVFCAHFPIITILSLVYDRTFDSFWNSELLKYLIIVSTTYVICISVAMFAQKYMPRIWIIINGRR